jgi:hypothetical protein
MWCEPLEFRRFLDAGATTAEPFGPSAMLIGQPRLIETFPTLTGSDQAVAIIDTGIDYTHPLLGGGFGPGFKVVGGFDFVDNDPDPLDTDGHGTAIAGLIAGGTFIRDGVRHEGLAPAANLVALRVAPDTSTTPNQRIEEALEWVLAHRATFNITAVNISFGFGHFDSEPEYGRFSIQLAALADAGVFVAAASGNGGLRDGPGVNYPAADPSAFGVGSVNSFDLISEFTERGRPLDLLAPGEELAGPWLDGQTRGVSGTSFASPLVAAAAVLLRQADPTLTPGGIASVLQASGADNLDGDDEFAAWPTTGLRFSRLDVANAVALAMARAPAAPDALPAWRDARTNALKYDRHGVLHAAWYDATATTLRYATRSPDGDWSAPLRVDPSEIDAGQYLSLALDSAGRPGIGFFDATNGDLRYARFDGDGTFTVDTLDSRQSVGLYPSTVFDTDNRPVVAYYQRTRGDLRLARHDQGKWAIQDLDRNRNDRGRSASLAISSIGRLAVAYEDSTSGQLMLTRQTAVGWYTDALDPTTAGGVAFISLAYGPADRLFASYYDSGPADLRFAAERPGEFGRFDAVTVARRGAVGLFSNLRMDADGIASILYYSRRHDALFAATGTLEAFIARRIESPGGRFASAASNPTTGAIAYTWLRQSDQSLQFDEIVL